MFDFLRKKIAGWLGKSKPIEKQKKGKKKGKAEKPEGKAKAALLRKEKAAPSLKKSEKVPATQQVPAALESEKAQEEHKENFFTKLIRRIAQSPLSQEHFDELFMELELTLLENNVALEAVDAIRNNLAQALVNQQMKKTEAEARILQALKDAILALLIEPPNLCEEIKKSTPPYVILFFGINGTGKTTSIAKLAHLLKKEGISCVLAAADTFRAASIEQLKTHAARLQVPVIASQYGVDPASVAFDAIAYARKHNIKAVLIDTAGRMYTKENLLKEMEKIVRVAKPNLKLFVGESITGNDVIEQVRTFNDAIGIDGIILTKADIDEKAGTILSVSHVTHKPIYFLGTGQGMDDLMPFTKKEVLKNLDLG